MRLPCCTRRIADRDPMQIVTLKGFGSGIGILLLALAQNNAFPSWQHMLVLLLLGFVVYGLSIYFYTYAQRTIGAARTSTYYALAPFIGALLSVLFLGEEINAQFVMAAIVMAVGCGLATRG